MPRSPDRNALALKRKLQQAESCSERTEPASKRHHLQGYDPKAPWLHETKPISGWRTFGNPAVHSSLPLANMVSAVQDLIDPEFDPLTAILDDEPRFLKPLPDRIAPEDLEFLRFRGALSIPETGLRNALLRSYVQWVHSFMPVINLQEFLRCVAENDPAGRISVLLFQAVMFVGTAFVDLQHLQDAGYSTRKSARESFYMRLKLLYSLDCEEDRIAILQTLLLMTYWSDPDNSLHRDIWDWIGICNTQAHSIGLNKDPLSGDIDPKIRRLRTRIWWCIYSRDRLIAMGLRRPLQVNDGNSNVPMLKLDDFDFEPFSQSVRALFHCRQLEDTSHQKRLATMFIEKVKLCQCIGRVLFAQYAPSQRQFGVTDRTTVTLVPRQASESEFARCSQKLESWLSSLPKDAQFIPESRSDFRDGEEVLLLHGAMLRMLYHATTSALHRPWATNTRDQSKARQERQNVAKMKMQDAATGITHIIQGLHQLNLTRFLPQTGVTVILPAAVAHLSNSSSDNPAVRENSISNFQRCVQVLHGLKDIYPAAGTEFANLVAAIKMQPGNCASNAFYRIMQYTFDASTSPSYTDIRKPSIADSVTSTETGQRPENPPTESWGAAPMMTNVSTNANQQTTPVTAHQTRHKNQQYPSMNQQEDKSPSIPAETQGDKRRSFPNDFDDHFALPTHNLSPGSENPFSYLSFDFNSFLDIPSPSTSTEKGPLQSLNFSPSADLDGIDWAQAFFRSTPLAEPGNPGEAVNYKRSPPIQNQSQSDREAETATSDMFSFPIDVEEDRSVNREYGAFSGGLKNITGDLDRDLGFQSEDERF
ncbi:Cutinase transcription factor 1 beta [Penicillium ucsense]|uniref:Cutinase transcription factor 1 beta n=1 Tax=Penicillium ucsense TaxID=2839758 RepID=A0A8J8WHR2_9EURO|nr:Cutinase transcription factor 1 beta [Penicillium ucsense]KAF7734703.1 Cutinase transcription factor 1 beta [Penicillium ucsense]